MTKRDMEVLKNAAPDYGLWAYPSEVGLSWEVRFESHNGRVIGKADTYAGGWTIMRNYYDHVK